MESKSESKLEADHKNAYHYVLRLKEKMERNDKKIQMVSSERGHTYRSCFANANCAKYSDNCFLDTVSCRPFVNCDGNKNCSDCKSSYDCHDIEDVIAQFDHISDQIHYFIHGHTCELCIYAAVMRYREVNYYLDKNWALRCKIEKIENFMVVDAFRRSQSNWCFDANIGSVIASFVE